MPPSGVPNSRHLWRDSSIPSRRPRSFGIAITIPFPSCHEEVLSAARVDRPVHNASTRLIEISPDDNTISSNTYCSPRLWTFARWLYVPIDSLGIWEADSGDLNTCSCPRERGRHVLDRVSTGHRRDCRSSRQCLPHRHVHLVAIRTFNEFIYSPCIHLNFIEIRLFK